jgi:hypothetical protein
MIHTRIDLSCGDEKPSSGDCDHDRAENDECQPGKIGEFLARRGQLLMRQRRRGELQEQVKPLDQKSKRHYRNCGPHPGKKRTLIGSVVAEVLDHVRTSNSGAGCKPALYRQSTSMM